MSRTCSTCRHWRPILSESPPKKGLCYRICAQPFLEDDPTVDFASSAEMKADDVTIVTLEPPPHFSCSLWDGRAIRRCGISLGDVRCERWWGHDGVCAGLDKEGEVVRWTAE